MTGAIICGVDDSESAKGAARVARSLGSALGRGVIFVRVVEPGAPPLKMNQTSERLERLSAVGRDVDWGAVWRVDAGHPADGLVAAAHKAHASMIVVGSTGPRSSLLGSVSADVTRRAPCPVVVVPPGADAQVMGAGDASLGLGDGNGDLAGGIVRFTLDSEVNGR